MDLGLRGKTAIIAAASNGLGKAVAVAFAAEGANVIMFARNGAAIQGAADAARTSALPEAQVVPLVGDVLKMDDLERVVRHAEEQFGGADILYNNAGGPRPGYFDDLTDADWEHAFNLNLMSAVRLTRLCLPHMRRQQWGRIITGISSSVKQPIDNLMLSNAIRSATTAWSKTLSDSVAREGITVNTLAPGRITTDRIRQIDGASAAVSGKSFEQITLERTNAIPMRRYGTPAEFAAAAVFLASEPAGYITGTLLLVDGGQMRATY